MAIKPDRGPSFFELLTQLAQKSVVASNLLHDIVNAPFDEKSGLRDQLHDVEHEADEINHAFGRKLNQSFVTPFDRDDMRELAGLLDDCVDMIDEAGDMIVLYKLDDIPENFFRGINQQVSVLQKSSELTAKALPRLKKPMELQPYWLEVNILENQADKFYRRSLADLFESGLDTLTVIKLKDLIETLEAAADAFEEFAYAIETIAVKES